MSRTAPPPTTAPISSSTARVGLTNHQTSPSAMIDRRDGEQHQAGVLLDDREGALRPDPVDFLCHAIRMPAVGLVWFP